MLTDESGHINLGAMFRPFRSAEAGLAKAETAEEAIRCCGEFLDEEGINYLLQQYGKLDVSATISHMRSILSAAEAKGGKLGLDEVKYVVRALKAEVALEVIVQNIKNGTIYTFKELNIHGNIDSEIDEVDLVNKVIYEDKNASRLYMKNPDFPQTEQQWAEKQIYIKGKNRIAAIQQSEYTLSVKGSDYLPSIELLKEVKHYIFRINADTPMLRQSVEQCLVKLKKEYPEYNFSATYGGK